MKDDFAIRKTNRFITIVYCVILVCSRENPLKHSHTHVHVNIYELLIYVSRHLDLKFVLIGISTLTKRNSYKAQSNKPQFVK